MKRTTCVWLAALLLSIGTQTAIAAETELGKVEVASDAYTFPGSGTGILDRTFDAFSYTNTTAAPVSVEVRVTGTRLLRIAAGGSGNASGRSWIAITDDTLEGRLVSSAQDVIPNQIASIGPAASQSYAESAVFTVSIPAGHRYTFQPFFRAVLPISLGTGTSVNTSAYAMRVVLK